MPPDELPDAILVSPRVSPRWIARLGSLAHSVEVSRCSAVDASAPAIGRARGEIARGRADRRRAIGLLLTREAGGHVLFGERVWRGEDPAGLPVSAALALVTRPEP